MSDKKRIIDQLDPQMVDRLRQEFAEEAAGAGAAGSIHPDVKAFIDKQNAKDQIRATQKELDEIVKNIM